MTEDAIAVLATRVTAIEQTLRDREPMAAALIEHRGEIMGLRERVATIESTGRELRGALDDVNASIVRLATSVESLVHDTSDIVGLTRGTKAWANVGKFMLTICASGAAATLSTLGLLEKLGYLRF